MLLGFEDFDVWKFGIFCKGLGKLFARPVTQYVKQMKLTLKMCCLGKKSNEINVSGDKFIVMW